MTGLRRFYKMAQRPQALKVLNRLDNFSNHRLLRHLHINILVVAPRIAVFTPGCCGSTGAPVVKKLRLRTPSGPRSRSFDIETTQRPALRFSPHDPSGAAKALKPVVDRIAQEGRRQVGRHVLFA